MSDSNLAEVESWFGSLAYKYKRELAATLKEEADGLADAIKGAAGEGLTGKLKQSVRVRRGRHTLELFVDAGGELTTKEVKRATRYRREVKIGQGDNQGIERDPSGEGVSYDYALGQEFGNSQHAANPFFWNTYRARREGIRERIEAKVADITERA